MLLSIRKQLRNSGVFATVIEPGSAVKPNTVLEINVSQLYGDFRQKDHPQAVLTMRFVFLDVSNSKKATALFEKEYTRQLPMKENSASALIEK